MSDLENKAKEIFINDIKSKIWDLKIKGNLDIASTDELFNIIGNYEHNFGKYKIDEE